MNELIAVAMAFSLMTVGAICLGKALWAIGQADEGR